MARNRIDACMFCDRIHTGACPEPKAAPVKVPAPKDTAPRVAKALPSKPKILSAKPIKTVRPDLSSVKTVSDADEPAMRAALTALAPLLHRNELELHRSRIDLPPHKIDALIWRQDHGRA